MKYEDYKVGDIVYVGEPKRKMTVYLATSKDGSTYKSLHNEDVTEYNGHLQMYLDGCWGGVK